MKILIIGFAKFRYMPYLTFYLNAVDKTKNSIDILYWDRDGKPDSNMPVHTNNIEFRQIMQDEMSKLNKIPAFIKYRRFAKHVIKNGNYDFIIALHTLPAVLLSDILLKKYRNRFILDYRDYTFEKFIPYKERISALVKASEATFTSSDAFRKYLPALPKVYTSHNIMLESLNHRCREHDMPQTIRIRYWGQIRYADTNIKLIDSIKNDTRFELHFHGREQAECERIINHCKLNGINNVFFHGEYNPSDRYKFAKETELIQNVQDYDSITDNAVSNKFYDGAIFYIPQICSDKSFMGKCVEKYGIGLACDVDSHDIAEKIYNYVTGLDRKQFCRNCDIYIDKVLGEYNNGLQKINSILN